MIHKNLERHGDTTHYVATFEAAAGWKLRPPDALLTDAVSSAWAEFNAREQERSRLDHERVRLASPDASAEALQADERAAAELPPGEHVSTAALDALTQARRTNMVARGGAALAAEAAAGRLDRMRHEPEFAALNPAAGAAAEKGRARALKLLDELAPLIDQVILWDAARRWTRGEPYNPDRGLIELAEAIRRHLSDPDAGAV